MEIGAIVLCRLDSQRLPGKVLRRLRGKPLLGHVISRCRQVASLGDNVIVATTTRGVDDPIAQYCKEEKIRLFRGSTADVSNRVLQCALTNGWEYFLRVNGDAPFLEPSLVTLACELVVSSGYDVVTNLYPRSFPYGIAVELIKTQVFGVAYRQMYTPAHFEHVTQFIYENMSLFRYYNILREGDNLSHLRLTVDTGEDWQKIEQVVLRAGSQWDRLNFLEAIVLYHDLGVHHG